MFFVVVFKILVTSVSNMDDSAANLVFEVDNESVFPWMEGTVYLLKGNLVMELPEIVTPGKINVKLMTSNHKSFI